MGNGEILDFKTKLWCLRKKNMRKITAMNVCSQENVQKLRLQVLAGEIWNVRIISGDVQRLLLIGRPSDDIWGFIFFGKKWPIFGKGKTMNTKLIVVWIPCFWNSARQVCTFPKYVSPMDQLFAPGPKYHSQRFKFFCDNLNSNHKNVPALLYSQKINTNI